MSARWILAIVLLAPCAPSRSTLESDPATAAATASDSSSNHDDKHDAPPQSSACPSSGVRCDEYGPTCDAGTTHCVCTGPCSGMELMPEEYYPRWACQERDRACPNAVPETGQACRPNGLRCGYGTCGGASAICEDKRWSVQTHAPPP